MGRYHAVADRLARRLAQLLLLAGGNGGGHALERFVQRRLLRVLQLGDHCDRYVAPVQHRARHAEAAGQAGAHVGDLLVEVARHVVEPADVVAVVAGILHPAAGHEGQVRPERGVGVERHLVAAQSDVGRQVLDLRAVHRQVDPVGRGQLVLVDAVERGQDLLPLLQPGLLAGGVDRVHARGVGVLAAAVLRLAPGPLLLVDLREEAVGFRFGRLRDRGRVALAGHGCLGRGRRAQREGNAKDEGGEQRLGIHGALQEDVSAR